MGPLALLLLAIGGLTAVFTIASDDDDEPADEPMVEEEDPELEDPEDVEPVS